MTLKAKVNGGAPQTGHVVVAAGDTVQLTADGMGSWDGSDPARWEIYDYLDGWSLPVGWTDDGDGIYYFLGNQEPPTFQPVEGSHYVTNLYWTEGGTRKSDTTTGIDCPTADGFSNLAALEGARFGNARQTWVKPLKSALGGIQSATLQGIKALGFVTGAQSFNGTAGNIVSLTATGNITLTLSNLVVGKDYSIDFTQDATGGRTLTLAGFTPLVAGSFDVDPTADATTVLTFRVIRAGKVMLSAPPATLIQTNLIRSAQATDLTLMPGDYDLSGIGTRCVSFNVKSANAAGKSGSWVTKCRDFGIVVDGWQYFATPGNPDTNPSVVQSCKDVFVIQRLGATCGYWEVESLGAGDFYYSLTGSGSSFNVRGGAGNFFTVTSAGTVTLSPKAADLRLTAASTYKVKIDEAGTEVCWFSDEAGVSTIEGQSTTCFKAASGANCRIQGNAVEIWDNVGPTKLATVDSAGGATTITEHQGIWINLGAIIIERPSTYRGFETPLVYHDLANGGARAFQSDSKGFAIGGATSVGQDGALKIPVLAGDPSGNPPAGFIYLYGKGTGVYSKNSSGTVVAL